MRAAIYARYSTDSQGETSIDGQVAVCREHVARGGWTVARVFADRGMSGADPRRPQYNALLDAARTGEFEAIVVEEVSRLWRSMGEQGRCVEEMERLGVRVVGVRDGVDTSRDGYELLLAVQGAMNARARREAGWRTHRGLATAFDAGKFTGGTPYGYRSVVTGHDANGNPTGHKLVIDPKTSSTVQWIFERYIAGESPQSIAHRLNQNGVKAPRGGVWSVSAIYGHARYQTGVLRNPIYAGRVIWNKSKWAKDTSTGTRTRKERPQSEWREAERPELRIVDDETWHAAQARRRGPNNRPGSPAKALFTGILRCGCCGGAVTAINTNSYGCAAHKNSGASVCAGVTVSRQKLDRSLLDVVSRDILNQEAIAEFKRKVVQMEREAEQEQELQGRSRQARLATLEGEIGRLVTAVAEAGWSRALSERLRAAEDERDRLTDALPTGNTSPSKIIPRMVDDYREIISNIGTDLKEKPAAARAALHGLLGDVILEKNPDGIYAKCHCYQGILNVVAGERYSIRNKQSFLIVKIT